MPIWAIKMTVKLILGGIPFKHQVLRRFGMFKHGKMDDIDYALKIFKKHMNRAFPDGPPESFTALELGPGDSLVSALIARAHGANQSYHVDVGAYAAQDVSKYKAWAQALKDRGLTPPDIENANTIDDILSACNARYLTRGLQSLQEIPSASVDLIWSHSVLEHVRKHDFAATMTELHRILKPSGRASHNVDLQDHFEKSLNNLRFSDTFWENNYVAGCGFYTNRMQYAQSLEIMRNAGFEILETNHSQWNALPVPKAKMQKGFQGVKDEDLLIRAYHVLLRGAQM